MKVVDHLLFLPAPFQVSFVLLFLDAEDQACFHIGVEVSSLVLQSKNWVISLIFCVGWLVVLVVGRGLPLPPDQLGMTLAHQHGGIQDQQPQAALDQHSVSAPISAMSPKSPNDPCCPQPMYKNRAQVCRDVARAAVGSQLPVERDLRWLPCVGSFSLGRGLEIWSTEDLFK